MYQQCARRCYAFAAVVAFAFAAVAFDAAAFPAAVLFARYLSASNRGPGWLNSGSAVASSVPKTFVVLGVALDDTHLHGSLLRLNGRIVIVPVLWTAVVGPSMMYDAFSKGLCSPEVLLLSRLRRRNITTKSSPNWRAKSGLG